MITKTEDVRIIVEDVFHSIGFINDWKTYEIYQEAIAVGLRLAGLKYERKKAVEIMYKDHNVGECQVDFLVHLGKENLVVHTDYYWEDLKNPAYYDDQMKSQMRTLGAKKGIFAIYGKSSPKQLEKPRLVIREFSL